MGLQNQLTDISSESFPILLLTLLANGVTYLRSVIFTFLHFTGFSSSELHPDQINHSFYEAIGSGLTGVIVLAEQLNLNRLLSYQQTGSGSTTCVVCLNQLGDGDRVRKLACRHVFHTHCFDGWLNTLNFNCPLCRKNLVSDERVVITQRRVAGDLLHWFSLT